MKQLEVQILGQSYLLGCPPGGEMRLLSAVEKVDTAMCKIRDAGKVRARDRIAVLAALNLAFDLPEVSMITAAPAAAASPPEARPSLSANSASTAAGQPSNAFDLSQPEERRVALLLTQLDAVLSSDGRLI